MAERGLVIARVGSRSLHPHWLISDKPRDWDLYLSPYQDLPPELHRDCEVGEVIPGPKWSGLRTLLQRWSGWRDYDYVWLPDDDILASQDTISRMFRQARLFGFDLFAPSLHEDSHFAHYFTMRNRSLSARAVGFVEIMVPGFSRAALEHLQHTLDLSTTGWGWGLDSVWPKLLDYQNVGILDGVPVLHTRPVGQFRDPELGRRVNEESDTLLRRYGCRQEMTVFRAFGPDLEPLDLGPDELLVTLAAGWSYLFDSDPRVLRWIVEHHKAAAGLEWPAYLESGHPTSPAADASGRRGDLVMDGAASAERTLRAVRQPGAGNPADRRRRLEPVAG